MWDLHGPGLEPVSPALAGGFLTTAPPGKSLPSHLMVRNDVFQLRSGARQGCPILPLLFNILEVLANAIRKGKEISHMQIGREDITLSVHR